MIAFPNIETLSKTNGYVNYSTIVKKRYSGLLLKLIFLVVLQLKIFSNMLEAEQKGKHVAR